MEPTHPLLPPPEFGHGPHLSLHDVFTRYTQDFWRWMTITTPTSVLAAFVLYSADQQIRTICGGIPRGEISHHFAAMAGTLLLRFGGFFIAWFLECFALAAIATAVNDLDSPEDGLWHRDSHQLARERFGSVLVLSLITFGMVGLLVFATGFVFTVVAWKIVGLRAARVSYLAALIFYVVVASIASWFGMAIPLVLAGDIGPWSAIKKSLKLSNGYESFLFLLVIESVIGSYLGWYATHYGLMLILPGSVRSASWYGWLVYSVSILASAAVQPPMFIGFSMLATRGVVAPPTSN